MPDCTTTVALADNRWVGHHPTYFREFIASLRRLGARVLALCPSPGQLETDPGVQAHKFEAPYGSVFRSSSDNDPLATILRWWKTRRALEALEERSGWRADLVFFPYLDTYLRCLPLATAPDILLGRPWSGLYFRNQHFGWAPNGTVTALRRTAKGDRALRSACALPSIGVLDERFDLEMTRLTGRSMIHFPDVTDETVPEAPTALSRKILEAARGRPIVGVIGLEKRKGVLTLLRAARVLHDAGDDLFLVATRPFHEGTFSAGEIEWMKQTARELEGSLYIDFDGGRIPDGLEFNAVFQTFSVAWAAYEDFQGSSNTLTKAAIFEKPVLATAGECVGKRVEDFRLGLCAQRGDIADVTSALRSLVRREDGSGRPLESRFAEYRRFHSRGQLDESFRRLLAQVSTNSRS